MINIFIVILLIVSGYLTGMVVNYLSDVLPRKRQLVIPFCLNCNQQYTWFDYLIITSRCKSCGFGRSRRTWIVISIYIVASLFLWFYPPSRLGYFISLLLLLYFGVVTVIDIEFHVILHPISVVGAIFGSVLGFYLHGFVPTVFGGLAGFIIMFLIYQLGPLFMRLLASLRKQAYEEEPLGFGDVYLSGVIGLMLGWPAVVAGIIITIISAGLFSFLFILAKMFKKDYHPNLAIPYGPFIVFGAFVLLFFRFLFIQ